MRVPDVGCLLNGSQTHNRCKEFATTPAVALHASRVRDFGLALSARQKHGAEIGPQVLEATHLAAGRCQVIIGAYSSWRLDVLHAGTAAKQYSPGRMPITGRHRHAHAPTLQQIRNSHKSEVQANDHMYGHCLSQHMCMDTEYPQVQSACPPMAHAGWLLSSERGWLRSSTPQRHNPAEEVPQQHEKHCI